MVTKPRYQVDKLYNNIEGHEDSAMLYDVRRFVREPHEAAAKLPVTDDLISAWRSHCSCQLPVDGRVHADH